MGIAEKQFGNEEHILNGRVRIVSILMFITSILTLITALTGVLYNKIYLDLIDAGWASNFAAAGAVNQDLLSIPCGLVLLVMSLLISKRKDYKLLIIALGVVGYIFYGYALYTFGRMLTPIYLIYILTFVLSTCCLIWGLLSFDPVKIAGKLSLRKQIRNSVGVFLITMTMILSIKWISDILLGSFRQTQPELYLIAAMDLGFALPFCGISALMLLKNNVYGIILSGMALIKIFTLCLSVAIGTFVAPYFDLPADYGTFAFFSILTAISLALKVWYLKGLE